MNEGAWPTDDTPAAGGTPRVRTECDGRRLRVYDPIEDISVTLDADRPVALRETDTGGFHFPVDTAVEFEAGRLRRDTLDYLYVRDGADGSVVRQVGTEERASVAAPPAGESHSVELPTGQCKLYLRVTDGFEVVRTGGGTELRFDTDGPATVEAGIRSLHESPAATLGIPRTAAGVTAALSRFGDALKTHSPERSYPTLRGHPPLVAFPTGADPPSYRVDGLEPVDPVVPLTPGGDPPDAADTPDAPVTFHVPPAPEWVFPLTSLAYYLDAAVVPDESGPPRLSIRPAAAPDTAGSTLLDRVRAAGDDPAATVRLGERDDPAGYGERVFDLLRHLFTLDCMVRTTEGGFYPHESAEYERVREDLPAWFDRELLYGAPLSARTRAYLAVPTSVTAPVWPRWRLTADLPPSFAHATLLPFLANSLAHVRVTDPDVVDVAAARGRSAPDTGRSDTDTAPSDIARSGAGRAPRATPTVRLPPTGSVAQVWAGTGLPHEGGSVAARNYLERLRSPPRERETTRVVVVCNAPEMDAERDVSDIYGASADLPFEVQVHEGLTTAALCDVLQSDCDLLHYIGHVRPEGIECVDGHVSAEEIRGLDVRCRGFLLNACRSYAPAEALVEAGAFAGVGTRTEVFDGTATRIGRGVARLLDRGFPFDVAVARVAERFPVAGGRYLTFGDGSLSLVQHEGGVPTATTVTPLSDGRFEVSLEGFPTRRFGLGSLYGPHLAPDGVVHVCSGDLGSYTVSAERLDWLLDQSTAPVVETRRGTHWWSDEVDAATLADPPTRRDR